MLRLTRSFFARNTLEVAADLLGKALVYNGQTAIITETEAYRGEDDPACHATRGRTKRTAVMFGPPGYSYVYFIYGMYHCLNFVTEPEGFGSAVLIRGVKLVDAPHTHLNGPGKLCRHLGIDLKDNGVDIINSDTFYVTDMNLKHEYTTTPRIGIRIGQDKLWRFVSQV